MKNIIKTFIPEYKTKREVFEANEKLTQRCHELEKENVAIAAWHNTRTLVLEGDVVSIAGYFKLDRDRMDIPMDYIKHQIGQTLLEQLEPYIETTVEDNVFERTKVIYGRIAISKLKISRRN